MKKILPFLLFSLPAFADLKVHEWGTFTSVMGPSGERLEGLHLEEEALPSFVYNISELRPLPQPTEPRPRRRLCGKGSPCDFYNDFNALAIDELPINPITHGVTQKMETPVIYFYGKEGTKAQVQIDFPQGLISQWFPDAQSFTPVRGEVSTLGPSQFNFEVTLKSTTDQALIPAISDGSIWGPARETSANVITDNNGNHEKFIFYRGIGDFDAHFKVTSKQNTVTILNQSKDLIPAVFVLKTDGVKGQIISLGQLNGEDKLSFDTHSLSAQTSGYVTKSKNLLVQSLTSAGLYTDEAQALANTWEKSYFKTPGLRILYVLPRSEVERILPFKLTADDKITELNRVLVGRVEVLTEEEQRATLSQIESVFLKTGSISGQLFKNTFGRFALPKAILLKQVIGEKFGTQSAIYNQMIQVISSENLNK